MKSICFLAILSLLVITSCDKETEYKTRTEFLTKAKCNKWYLEYATVSTVVNGQEVSQRLTQYIPDCMEDNSISFKPDGTVAVNEGMIKCDEGAEESKVMGGWQLLNNDAQLRATIPNLPVNVEFDIMQLDEKYLKIQWRDIYLNTPSRFEAIFSHRH
jgi:hypothetical protein